MLISCRKEGECLQVGEEIEIRIISVRKNKVTLGVVAPRELKIETRKLNEIEMANTEAAAQSFQFGKLIGPPRSRGENIRFVLEDTDFLRRKSELTDKRNGRPDE
jgi:carbon storage regulator